MIGLHLLQQVSDTTTFQLEHPLRFTAAEQAKSRLIIERELLRVDTFSRRLLDQVDGFPQDRQVAKTKKVHFQQPGRFDINL